MAIGLVLCRMTERRWGEASGAVSRAARTFKGGTQSQPSPKKFEAESHGHVTCLNGHTSCLMIL